MDQDDRFEALTRTVAAHRKALLAHTSVTGVGCGLREGVLAVIVMVDQNALPDGKVPLDTLPDTLDGFPLVVEPVGEVVAY